jgi:hypothetical protein
VSIDDNVVEYAKRQTKREPTFLPPVEVVRPPRQQGGEGGQCGVAHRQTFYHVQWLVQPLPLELLGSARRLTLLRALLSARAQRRTHARH